MHSSMNFDTYALVTTAAIKEQNSFVTPGSCLLPLGVAILSLVILHLRAHVPPGPLQCFLYDDLVPFLRVSLSLLPQGLGPCCSLCLEYPSLHDVCLLYFIWQQEPTPHVH